MLTEQIGESQPLPQIGTVLGPTLTFTRELLLKLTKCPEVNWREVFKDKAVTFWPHFPASFRTKRRSTAWDTFAQQEVSIPRFLLALKVGFPAYYRASCKELALETVEVQEFKYQTSLKLESAHGHPMYLVLADAVFICSAVTLEHRFVQQTRQVKDFAQSIGRLEINNKPVATCWLCWPQVSVTAAHVFRGVDRQLARVVIRPAFNPKLELKTDFRLFEEDDVAILILQASWNAPHIPLKHWRGSDQVVVTLGFPLEADFMYQEAVMGTTHMEVRQYPWASPGLSNPTGSQNDCSTCQGFSGGPVLCPQGAVGLHRGSQDNHNLVCLAQVLALRIEQVLKRPV